MVVMIMDIGMSLRSLGGSLCCLVGFALWMFYTYMGVDMEDFMFVSTCSGLLDVQNGHRNEIFETTLALGIDNC